MFALGTASFTIFSARCALAPTLPVLVVMRALQGLGAAAMLAQVLATIQALYEGEPRRRAVLAYTTVLGAAASLGQLIGGGLLALNVFGLGWRALFAINVPIGVLALALVPLVVPPTRAVGSEPIDLVGGALLVSALIPLLLGMGIGSAHGWSGAAWSLLGAGALLAGLLPFVERRVRAPLLPGRLLRQRSAQLGLVVTLVFYSGNSATLLGLTLFLQDGQGVGALGAGAAYLPIGIAYMVTTLVGRRPGTPNGPSAMLCGSAITLIGLASAAAADLLGRGPTVISLLLAPFGIGMGLVYPAILTSVIARVQPGDEGAASGIVLTTTQIANAVGIAGVSAAWHATGSLLVTLAITAVLTVCVAAVGAQLRVQIAWAGAELGS
jgi:predicted MFS family arabinose efflux permease